MNVPSKTTELNEAANVFHNRPIECEVLIPRHHVYAHGLLLLVHYTGLK